jgi:hypothetical protein
MEVFAFVVARLICGEFHLDGHWETVIFLITEFVVNLSLVVMTCRLRDKLLEWRNQRVRQ